MALICELLQKMSFRAHKQRQAADTKLSKISSQNNEAINPSGLSNGVTI
ncbi:hypothetical protein HCH_02294 [Hahella chejuensis KCTC 2396]|uniref:Uncharacterized protein n=1 Tax=Hahella chejuensis (strain KCTC 2396) TaxID=349521 RepID=Q2SJQ7_HAHCH|nr:hypothetical protein HCH_02294 [Hahella chejuensis KCTC 2396]